MARNAHSTSTLDHLAVALEHPLRRRILELLRNGPKLQTELARALPVAYNSTLKHLGFLERAGLVVKTQHGHKYEYELQAAPLNRLVAWISTLYPDEVGPDSVAPMPSSVDQQLRNAVESFVNDMSALIRQAAVEAVTEAVGRGTTIPTFQRRLRRSHGARATPSSATRGHKRTPQELERTTARLLGYITKNPGQRIEQIAVALGTSTKDLALPAKKLIAANCVKVKGVKRATMYWAK